MTLKTEIDKSNKLKEDLKLAKENINARILSGGGTRANTISDVPSAIDKMITDNYKKVAFLDYSNALIPIEYEMSKTINWNLNFTPEKIILRFSLLGDYNNEIGTGESFIIPHPSKMQEDADIMEARVLFLTGRGIKSFADIKFSNITSSGVNIQTIGTNTDRIYINYIIAIE